MRKLVRQAAMFLAVGGLSAGLDGGIYFVLVLVGVNAVVASPTSFLCSVFFNYFGNKKVVFASKRAGSLWRYGILVAINAVLSTGIVAGGLALGLAPLVAKVISMGLIASLNFLSLRTWVFGDTTIAGVRERLAARREAKL